MFTGHRRDEMKLVLDRRVHRQVFRVASERVRNGDSVYALLMELVYFQRFMDGDIPGPDDSKKD